MQSEWGIQLAEAKEHQASRTGEAPHYDRNDAPKKGGSNRIGQETSEIKRVKR